MVKILIREMEILKTCLSKYSCHGNLYSAIELTEMALYKFLYYYYYVLLNVKSHGQ